MTIKPICSYRESFWFWVLYITLLSSLR